jgi:hypothetical protein
MGKREERMHKMTKKEDIVVNEDRKIDMNTTN